MPRPQAPALLSCGAVAGPLFVSVFLVLGAARAGYEPLRHPVSSLEIGDSGWTQRLNFLVTGVLVVAFSAGLRTALRPLGGSRWGPNLVALAGVGLFTAGLFVADPFNGYPPGTPLVPVDRTVPGALHDAVSSLFFFALPAACLVLARRFHAWGQPLWARYSIGTALAFIVFFALTALGLQQVGGLEAIAGLLQRITIMIGLGWISLLAARITRKSPSPSP
jgi:hypothetical membrane protein